MNKVNKNEKNISMILKCFTNLDIGYIYLGIEARRYYDGRCFRNGDVYYVGRYQIQKGEKEFIFEYKLTGRPEYTLVKSTRYRLIAFSQKSFIEALLKDRDIYGDKVFGEEDV